MTERTQQPLLLQQQQSPNNGSNDEEEAFLVTPCDGISHHQLAARTRQLQLSLFATIMIIISMISTMIIISMISYDGRRGLVSSWKSPPILNSINSMHNSNEEHSHENTKEEEFLSGTDEEAKNDTRINSTLLPKHVLSSYTYSDCPFTMAKFSQYHLAHEGPFKSKADRLINSSDRAQAALDFSNEARAYERVVSALENGAFDWRTIILDGDSLTRQLFISLGCLAWSAGYVIEYDIPMKTNIGNSNSIMKNAQYEASSKFFSRGSIKLKGGGQIYYVSNPSEEKIEKLSERMIQEACDNTNTTTSTNNTKYQARYNFGKDLLKMNATDIVVYGAGHHQERSKYISTYKKFFQCMQDTKSERILKSWPHFMYQLASVESFWTKGGNYGGERIEGGNRMSCQSSIDFSPHREEERAELGELVSFIGDTIDLENLGEYHVWHGDCLHWLQPGIPDLYAGELADFLLSTSNN